ncbi:MAG: sigma-54-dependent Fis family transcriptional regulator [Planctomycetaceae bacterium]|nr:sigma-54-dependent Fis family transcriptional regulator [Planctomycetaceae bacterium]
MPHLLLIDDDLDILPQQIRHVFPAPEYRVGHATTGGDGVERVRREPPDVILLDLRLPDQSGLEVFRRIRAIDARIPVVFVTVARSADDAIEMMKQGAYEYLLKPLDLKRLERVVDEAVRDARLMRVPARLVITPDADDLSGDSILGSCPAMQEIYKAIGRVAATNLPVLICGESGTGKELVARAVYQHSARSGSPFLALNCAAIPESLLESELFGHERGAFTGADRRRVGKFEQCNGGTLFLDEIGDMPLGTQAKVLRVLQEQEFERVGGDETVRTDVRLIAATHRDLKRWSDEGKYRADLYYRIGGYAIDLPPLRERGDDLPMLVRHYLRRFGRELGREIVEVAPAAMGRLRDYTWPGNIRELQNVLRQALLRARGPVLRPEFLPELPQAPDRVGAGGAAMAAVRGPDLESFIRRGLAAGTGGLHEETHRWVDRILLPMVLEHTHGNQRQAAQILGIARKTLRDKLRELGITVQRSLDLGEGDEG